MTNALGADDNPEMAAVNAVVGAAADALRSAGATVVEVEIPQLIEHIVQTSMYTDRSKHDLDLFLSERADAPVRSLREVYESGRYHHDLDLMDAIMAGPDRPEDDSDYLRRFAARHRH